MLVFDRLTEEAKQIIEESAPKGMGEIIDDFIAEDDKTNMQEGVEYYLVENDILDRERWYWYKGEKKKDDSKPNNTLAHAWHTVLVDQKAGYLVGKPVTFSDKEAETNEDGETTSPNEEFINEINDLLGENFNDTVNDLVVGASNKGVEWLHPYIDKQGNFKYKIIDARQIIPIWKDSEKEELEAVIRYYIVTVNDEKRIKAEFWTSKKVKFFIENEAGELVPDTISEDKPEDDHFTYKDQGYGWEQVPFIPFKNNKHMTSDLKQYKTLADNYDLNVSDRSNDLEELKKAIWNLKNYAGEDLAEFQHNLRYYGAIETDGEGGVEAITLDIPTEAHENHLNRLEEDIITFGQGVNPKTDQFGSNPTGVALQFLFSLLDLKADKTERKFQRSFRKLFWFIAEYLRMIGQGDYDPSVVNATFNRSMIANESEKVDMANKSKGVVSDRTVVENHPWVDDPDKEMNRIKNENKNKVTLE